VAELFVLFLFWHIPKSVAGNGVREAPLSLMQNTSNIFVSHKNEKIGLVPESLNRRPIILKEIMDREKVYGFGCIGANDTIDMLPRNLFGGGVWRISQRAFEWNDGRAEGIAVHLSDRASMICYAQRIAVALSYRAKINPSSFDDYSISRLASDGVQREPANDCVTECGGGYYPIGDKRPLPDTWRPLLASSLFCLMLYATSVIWRLYVYDLNSWLGIIGRMAAAMLGMGDFASFCGMVFCDIASKEKMVTQRNGRMITPRRN
jgi:hypothetical protein